MDRTAASLLTPVRLALAAALVGVVSLVPAAALATTVPTYSLVVLAALTVAAAALLDSDVRRHPVRPRAPGLV